jgi:hypothetical protein
VRGEQVRDPLRQPGVQQVARGEVDRHPLFVPGTAPGCGLGDRLLQHGVGQRAHQPVDLGQRQELRRTEQSARRVRPAHQCLDPDRWAGGDVDLRLVAGP